MATIYEESIEIKGQKYTVREAPVYTRARITPDATDSNFATLTAERDAHQVGSNWQVWIGEPSPGNRPLSPNTAPYGLFETREAAIEWLWRAYGPQPDWRIGETWADVQARR